MNISQENSKLLSDKLIREHDFFYKELLGLSKESIIKKADEILIKRCIVKALGENSLGNEAAVLYLIMCDDALDLLYDQVKNMLKKEAGFFKKVSCCLAIL